MNAADRQRPPPGQLYLDHVSHFVPDLEKAGALLELLGFAVTPLSAQMTQDGPAGTSNRSVMLAQGYLEFLTPTADTPNAERMRASMRRYRGVHVVCFGTPFTTNYAYQSAMFSVTTPQSWPVITWPSSGVSARKRKRSGGLPEVRSAFVGRPSRSKV